MKLPFKTKSFVNAQYYAVNSSHLDFAKEVWNWYARLDTKTQSCFMRCKTEQDVKKLFKQTQEEDVWTLNS